MKLAEKAGELILRESKKTLRIKHKGKNDLVTQADKAAEKLITTAIQKKFPEHGIIAEESFLQKNLAEISRAPYVWIVDPLDGTTNFAHGLQLYSISIAVLKTSPAKQSKNFQYLRGELVAGVVFAPALNEIFYCEKGKGAFLNGRKIRISKTGRLANSFMVTGFPYTHQGINLPYFETMLPKCLAIRRLGSAALDMAYTAAGRFDGYWEFGLKPWDIAAGSLLVKEAGGRVTDTNGNILDLFGNDILATNNKIHKETIKLFNKINTPYDHAPNKSLTGQKRSKRSKAL